MILNINVFGIDMSVEHDYSFTEQLWSYPNGDPGHPEHEEIDIISVKIGETCINQLVFNLPELFQIIEDTISDEHRKNRYSI
jgi:hypothetical protein